MPKDNKKRQILGEARAWAAKRELFGTQAFLKYVILCFIENLNQVSDEIVFKGGNLLWVYIGTPRATTDLDLATLKIDSHACARELIENACNLDSEIVYSLCSFREVDRDGKVGAALTIRYSTVQGASNQFEVEALLKARKIFPLLDIAWINREMEQLWRRHHMRYPDLPGNLEELFVEVNEWLTKCAH